jgi:DNA-binding NarL/FixJ family response regulator
VIDGSTIELGHVAGSDTAPEFWSALFKWGAENERAIARIYRRGPGSLETAWRFAARDNVAFSNPRAAFEPHGVTDLFTLAGHDASGAGIFVTIPLARRWSEPGLKQRRAFERLALELATAARFREHRRRAQTKKLSASELHIARMLAAGASDKLIAAELGVALSTVSTFTRRLRRKLGCLPGAELLFLRSRGQDELTRRLSLFERLTTAELAVVADLLVGASHRDIAEARGVSPRTVASQCAAVFRKCEVSGRRELAAALLGGRA